MAQPELGILKFLILNSKSALFWPFFGNFLPNFGLDQYFFGKLYQFGSLLTPNKQYGPART